MKKVTCRAESSLADLMTPRENKVWTELICKDAGKAGLSTTSEGVFEEENCCGENYTCLINMRLYKITNHIFNYVNVGPGNITIVFRHINAECTNKYIYISNCIENDILMTKFRPEAL